ncbi:hypothetical protein NKH18_31890 [Streptomyces sp. M10(2022)]
MGTIRTWRPSGLQPGLGLHQAGRLADAERIATATAERIEPTFRSRPVELSLWGSCYCGPRPPRCVRDATTRSGSCSPRRRGGCPHRYGPTRLRDPFGPTNVGVAKVNFLVEMEESAEALRTARSVPELESLPPTWQARFHVDRALAFAELDKGKVRCTRCSRPNASRRSGCVTTRPVGGSFPTCGRERRRSSPVTELADRLGLDG